MTTPHNAESLWQHVGPDVYRRNAFRVANLPVDVTPREVDRELTRVQLREKARGGGQPEHGPAARPAGGAADALREALQRLRAPEARLIDELLWFWPARWGEGRSDPAVLELRQGNVAAARALWLQGNDGVSLHNLAVLEHMLALDLEHATCDAEQAARRDRHWHEALTRWRDLLAGSGFWGQLEARIRARNEPELRATSAERIRADLGGVLLGINARLAVRAAEQGAAADVERQRQIMERFAPEGVERALRLALRPVRQRLNLLRRGVEAESDALANPADRGRQRAFGIVVSNCQGALTQLERMKPLPLGGADRAVLEDMHSFFQRELETSACWFCRQRPPDPLRGASFRMIGKVTRDREERWVTWYERVIQVPRCEPCYQTHRCWTLRKAMGDIPPGMRPEADQFAFPAVDRLRAEGWEIGNRPAGI